MEFFLYTHKEQFKAMVYRNLHEQCWSIKALSGHNRGRTVIHAGHVVVQYPEFYVSQKGRERVLREQRKNVHAGVVGYVLMATVLTERYETYPRVRNENAQDIQDNLANVATHPAYREVTYNPYKFDRFVFKDDQSEAVAGRNDCVVLTPDGKVYVEYIEVLQNVVKQKRRA